MPESFLNALLPFKFGSLSTPPPGPLSFSLHLCVLFMLSLIPVWSNLSHFFLSLLFIILGRHSYTASFTLVQTNTVTLLIPSSCVLSLIHLFSLSLPLISHTFESFLSPCVYSSLIHLSLSLSLPLKAHVSQSLSFPLHLLSLIPLTSTLSHIHSLYHPLR